MPEKTKAATFKRGTFKIAVNPRAPGAESDSGERTGLICGPLAIHGNKYGYTVTHLASGFTASEPHGLADTKKLCLEMLALPVRWDIESPLENASPEVIGRLIELKRKWER